MTSSTEKLTRIYEPFSHTFMRFMCGMGVFMLFMLVFAIGDMISKQAWEGLFIIPFIGGVAFGMLRMYGPLKPIYATDQIVQVRTRKENLEIPFSELTDVKRPWWASMSNMGISVVELQFTRETPRIRMTIRDTDLEKFKARWKSAAAK